MYPYINIFGRTIGTYGVCMMIAVLLCGWLAIRNGKKYDVRSEDIIIVGTASLGIGLLCGTLLYIFVTYPIATIVAMIKSGDFSFLQSGIVFYGGLIGGIAGAMIGTHIAKCKFSDVLISLVPFIPLGHAIGRVGCTMAGCCHGMEYDGFLAIHYPHSLLGLDPAQGYFPVQLMESAMNLVICGILLFAAKKTKRKENILFVYLSLYALARFVLEYFRGDEARGIYLGFSLSQWISIGLMLAGIAGILYPKWKRIIKTERSE